MLYKVGPRAVLFPTVSWLIILLALFATEYLVMLALAALLPYDPSPLVGALIDSLTVTAILAPIIWWTLVRPLQEVIRLRTRFLSDLFAAIEAERQHTAYELHDGIGQELSLLISGLRTTRESLGNEVESVRLGELQNLAQTALKEVRRIALGLRPSLLDDLGLAIAVEKVVRDFRELSPVDITLQMSSLEGVRLPDSVETAAFRIFQEALSNVIRHSGARHVTIQLNYQSGELALSIHDDGAGFDPTKAMETPAEGSHMGLPGIRERVALLGGRFSLDTSPGNGCRIAVALPIEGKIHE